MKRLLHINVPLAMIECAIKSVSEEEIKKQDAIELFSL